MTCTRKPAFTRPCSTSATRTPPRKRESTRPLGQKCPNLRKRGHGSWYFRYDAPPLAGQPRRRPEFGPFETKKRAEEELTAELARVGGGVPVTDRSILVRDYLDTWLSGKKLRLKPDTYTWYVEACELYFKPGVGHLHLVELRDRHLQDLVTAMTQINQPPPDDEKPSEMLRRLFAVRADDTRKMLSGDETRRKKSPSHCPPPGSTASSR